MNPTTFEVVDCPATKPSRSIWGEVIEAYRSLPAGKAIAIPIVGARKAHGVAQSIRRLLGKACLPSLAASYDRAGQKLYIRHRPAAVRRATAVAPSPEGAPSADASQASAASAANGAKSRFAHQNGPINPRVVGAGREP